jgi:hypothetical protein
VLGVELLYQIIKYFIIRIIKLLAPLPGGAGGGFKIIVDND